MATIQFGGVVSGLNTQGIIDALVGVKTQPLTRLQAKETSLTAQKTAYTQIGTALDDLVAKIKNFTVTGAGASRTAAYADTSILTATAGTSAAVGQYQVSVDRLATATRASSTGAIGAAVTGTEGTFLSALNLPGSVTGGQISAIVDGVIVHYTVGDPTQTTLAQVLDGFSAAIQSQLQSGGATVGADPGATVTASVVNNRVQLSISGAGVNHSLSFGAAGDKSNALGMLGLANVSASNATNPTLTGASNLGVVRLNGALDSAGLTGLTSTATGVLTINGVAIDYNTATDSVSKIVSRINNSGAGVIASVDRATDKIMLARKDTGALAIDIDDTSGTLGAALKLAPGTTNAQTIGLTAQVTVDGRSIVSTSNAVSNAIDGVVLNLVSRSPLGEAQTLTVGVDQDTISSALNAVISSFNSLGDSLDKMTATTPGQTGGTAGTAGPLASDPTVRSLFLQLRSTLFSASGTGAISSLGALGLNTGAVGSATGTTDRLHLDATKLTAALNADATQVATLLDGPTGPLAKLLAQLKSFEDPASTKSFVQAHTAGLASEIADLHVREASQQEIIDNYQSMIEAQYAALEATLAQLQSQSSQIAATLGYSTTSGGSSSS
jgi:flagellar hook-associated protein 2